MNSDLLLLLAAAVLFVFVMAPCPVMRLTRRIWSHVKPRANLVFFTDLKGGRK